MKSEEQLGYKGLQSPLCDPNLKYTEYADIQPIKIVSDTIVNNCMGYKFRGNNARMI